VSTPWNEVSSLDPSEWTGTDLLKVSGRLRTASDQDGLVSLYYVASIRKGYNQKSVTLVRLQGPGVGRDELAYMLGGSPYCGGVSMADGNYSGDMNDRFEPFTVIVWGCD